ncbi:MAG: hypothetical protein AB1324_06900 [Candidatus Micrarchaeota archaeon]
MSARKTLSGERGAACPKVMDSLEDGRRKFSPYTPLADRLEKKLDILSIGEYFGGTKAFNMRALIGICGLIQEKRKEGGEFDLIVLNGGVLPEVPKRGSRLNRKKMSFLMDGIEDIEDAGALMRRPMKMLAEAAGKTPIIYVMGEDDSANIEAIIDRKIAESRKAENIRARIQSLADEGATLESRMASMQEETESLERELKETGRKRKRIRKDGERGTHGLEEHIRKLAKDIRSISRKMDELSARKRRADERRTLLEDDLANLGAVKRTNTEFLTPGETKALIGSATKEYTDLLFRLFEGADVRILDKNVSLVELSGLRMALGHSLENTSSTAKKSALASYEEAQSKMQIYGLLPQVDLLLFSHHPGTKGWALPQRYLSEHPLYLFQQGGLPEPKALFDAHNCKIKTVQTEALGKYQLDSGVTVIKVLRDGAFSFDMLGLEHLEQFARPGMAEESANLMRRLNSKRMSKENAGEEPQNHSALELPSRISDGQLRWMVKAGIDPYRFVRPARARELREVIAEIHSDYHIGVGNLWDAHSNQEIMRAVIMDSVSLGRPDLIILGGDMVEGTLGSKANEVVARNFLDEHEFSRLLRERVDSDPGLGELDYERAMKEFYRRASYAQTVPNLDQQVSLLQPLLEHAAKIIEAGGEAIIISGNHYNQSHRDERLDEGIRLASAIRMIGGFPENDPRIHIFYGGWIGSGQVTVKGIPIFAIHKARSSRDHVTGLMEHKTLQRRDDAFLFVQGHHHDMSFGKTISDAHVSAPSIAPVIPYVDQAALHGGLQGYTRMTLYSDSEGKHAESIGVMNRFLPQLQKFLDGIDPLFLEVFSKMIKKEKS